MSNRSYPTSFAILLFFCLGAVTPHLKSQETSQSPNDRYAVMEFQGMSEFPHANQPSPGFDEESPPPEAEAEAEAEGENKVSISETRFFLIADTQDGSLDVYFDLSLWKFGKGGLDPLKSLWHLKGDEVSNVSSWGRPVSKDLIWSIKTGSLFADTFELPVENSVEKIVEKVEEQCARPLFGVSAELNDGPLQRQRIVDPSGNLILMNESYEGKIQRSLRVERDSETSTSFRCKLIVYHFEKPIETIEGILSLSMRSQFPPQITAWSDSVPKSSDVQPELSGSLGSPSSSVSPKLARLEWSWLVAIVAGLSLICVLFGVYFVSRTKRNEL